jgi:hypothetical protein
VNYLDDCHWMSPFKGNTQRILARCVGNASRLGVHLYWYIVRYIVVILLLYCWYIVVILLVYCCYIVGILLLYCWYIVVILLLYCCYIVVIEVYSYIGIKLYSIET